VLESLGLQVNRLIRLSYGPLALGVLDAGEIEEVGPRVLREQFAGFIAPEDMPKGDRPAYSPPKRNRGVGAARRAAAAAEVERVEAKGPVEKKAYKPGWAKPKITVRPKGAPKGKPAPKVSGRDAALAEGRVMINKARVQAARATAASAERPERAERPDAPRPRTDRPDRPRAGPKPGPAPERPRTERHRTERPKSDRPPSDRPRSDGPRSQAPRADRAAPERPRAAASGKARPEGKSGPRTDRPQTASEPRKGAPAAPRGPRPSGPNRGGPRPSGPRGAGGPRGPKSRG
ncbi:MAG: hypothetical protein V7702_13995, partial [Phenylobacterium sp.]